MQLEVTWYWPLQRLELATLATQNHVSEAEIFIPELYDSVAEVALHVLQDFRPKQLVTLAESFSKAKAQPLKFIAVPWFSIDFPV